MKLVEAVSNARRVYLIGNGGSYANAVHIANDLISVGVRAYTLDPATLTAFANDYGYEKVFSRWLSIVGEKGDLLVALSGSGTSANIIEAIETAQRIGMKTWLVSRHLQGIDMQQSEEEQLKVGHAVMKELRAG